MKILYEPVAVRCICYNRKNAVTTAFFYPMPQIGDKPLDNFREGEKAGTKSKYPLRQNLIYTASAGSEVKQKRRNYYENDKV